LVVDIEVARAQGLYPLAKALIAKLVKKNSSEAQGIFQCPFSRFSVGRHSHCRNRACKHERYQML
jgi:hypothetical protein